MSRAAAQRLPPSPAQYNGAIGVADSDLHKRAEHDMAKPNYSFAKRQRDLAKKQKKEEKLQKKNEAKAARTPEDTDSAAQPAAEPAKPE